MPTSSTRLATASRRRSVSLDTLSGAAHSWGVSVGGAGPLVGRERELSQLLDVLRATAAGRGRTVFVSGEIGAGKQALLNGLEARVTGDSELAATFFAKGNCDRFHEGKIIFEPFAEMLPALLADDWRKRTARALSAVVKQTAPDWLGIIPFAGGVLAAAAKSAQVAYKALTEDESKQLAQDRVAQFLAAVTARLKKSPAVVLIATQAQWIDAASAGLVERVGTFAAENRIALLVAGRMTGLNADHPLKEVQSELTIKDLADEIVLDGLDDSGVGELARIIGGRELEPDVCAWLHEYTGGNPMFISKLLPLLKERQILVPRGDVYGFAEDANAVSGTLELSGRLEGMMLPKSVSLAVDESLKNIPDADVTLLECASVEGRRFLSSTISRVAEIEERQLLRRLGDVQQRFGLIHAQPVIRKRQYAYEFIHQLLQQQIYLRLDENQRAEYHLDVAEALVETFGENAAQGILLDIARHFAQGHDLASAASYYLRAARTVAAGGAPPEAIALGRRGLTLVREAAAEDASDSDLARLRAELIYLLVMASDAGWVEAADNPETLQALIAEGKAAGESSGDDELRARLLLAEGARLRSRHDTRAARTTLEKSLELARKADASGNPESAATQVAIMTALGRVIDMEDLEQGLATLRDAQQLYLNRLQPSTGEAEPELARLFYRLRGAIGVAEFDRGNLGEARRELDACIGGLEQLERVYDLPRYLNYRAQIELASGDFDAAEADLRRALEHALPGAWAAYNRALLGKVFLDSEKYETAAPQLRQAWKEVQADPEPSFVIPVRAYLIEYLLRDGSAESELAEAGPLIADEIQDAEAGSFAYAVAWGESLGAELALRTNDTDTARTRSSHAVAILEAANKTSLPIVRTEEVLWRHARVLEANGSPEFKQFRTQARDTVARKAKSLPENARPSHGRTPTARRLAEAGSEADNG